jgi:hypothetical protein
VPSTWTDYLTEPYTTDYTPVITGAEWVPDNTVESVVGEDLGDGPLTSDNTDGGGGVGQDVAIGGTININEDFISSGIVGGGTVKWIFDGDTWKLK